jgi:signal transduction histidine kinase
MSLHRLRGLLVQLLLWISLPLILMMTVLSVISITTHQASMRELVERLDSRIVALAAGRLSEALVQRVNILYLLLDETVAQNRHLPADPARTMHSFDGGVALYDNQGLLLEASPDAATWETRPVVELLQKAQASNQPAFSPFFQDKSPGTALLIAVPARQGSNLTIVGAISPERLGMQALIAELSADARSKTFLVNREGQVIYSSNAAQFGEDLSQHEGAAQALQGKTGATYYRETGGQEWAVGYAPVELAGWGLVVQEPWEDLIVPTMSYSLLAPVVVLVATAFSLLAIYFGLRNVVRPLQALRSQAARVAWGDFGATWQPVGGIQEIEELRRTLNEMAEQIRRYQSSMRDYIACITRGQEDERQRLARELHDDTLQALIALNHRAEMARRALARDPGLAQERLGELKEMIEEAIESLHRFTRDLRPIYLEDLGLLPALEMLVRDLPVPSADAGDGQHGIQATFAVKGDPRRLSPELELTAYRIAQEALNNVARHAQARTVNLTVEFDAEGVTLTVLDDGIGFTVPEFPDTLAQEGHFGLMGMRERAMLFGGHISISSQPGQGTKVVCYLPDQREGEVRR